MWGKGRLNIFGYFVKRIVKTLFALVLIDSENAFEYCERRAMDWTNQFFLSIPTLVGKIRTYPRT